MKVGYAFREIAAMAERSFVCDVTRVAINAAGVVYLAMDVVEGHSSLRAKRTTHHVSSSKMRATKDVVKQLFRHPDHGPSPAERQAESPVEHSRRVRTQRFRELFDEAVEKGVSEDVLWDLLQDTGEAYARQCFEQENGKLIARGKAPKEEPADLGGKEFAAVRDTRTSGREPEFWMYPAVKSAIADPAGTMAASWRSL